MQEARIIDAVKSSSSELYEFLEEKYNYYNRPDFIQNDPISIPRRFGLKEDIEIAGFLAATISWGNRRTIIKNALDLMQRMDNAPFQFITQSGEKDLMAFKSFVHRTFNADDCIYFLNSLRNIYCNHNGLDSVFSHGLLKEGSLKGSIIYFRTIFFELPHLTRTQKHIANPDKNASAKRINMFLRWMVRKDDRGVDLGIWPAIDQSKLFCPLDVHSGNQSRRLGLLYRKQNDWKAVEELTASLRRFDPLDPVKYDFALFGSGLQEKS